MITCDRLRCSRLALVALCLATSVGCTSGTQTGPGGSPRAASEVGGTASANDPDDPDGDGVANDACPDRAEDLDGRDDADGCPDLDHDGDGVEEPDDGCPDLAGPDGGCPWQDPDRDGLSNEVDACPEEAETLDGVADDDGCPDTPSPWIWREGDRLVLADPPRFEPERKHLLNPESVVPVVAWMERHPEVERLEIRAHRADWPGYEAYGMRITDAWGEAVRDRLVERGVDPDRLSVVGYGESRPIATNRTAEGRARNDRIEFVVAEERVAPGPTTIPLGDGYLDLAPFFEASRVRRMWMADAWLLWLDHEGGDGSLRIAPAATGPFQPPTHAWSLGAEDTVRDAVAVPRGSGDGERPTWWFAGRVDGTHGLYRWAEGAPPSLVRPGRIAHLAVSSAGALAFTAPVGDDEARCLVVATDASAIATVTPRCPAALDDWQLADAPLAFSPTGDALYVAGWRAESGAHHRQLLRVDLGGERAPVALLPPGRRHTARWLLRLDAGDVLLSDHEGTDGVYLLEAASAATPSTDEPARTDEPSTAGPGRTGAPRADASATTERVADERSATPRRLLLDPHARPVTVGATDAGALMVALQGADRVRRVHVDVATGVLTEGLAANGRARAVGGAAGGEQGVMVRSSVGEPWQLERLVAAEGTTVVGRPIAAVPEHLRRQAVQCWRNALPDDGDPALGTLLLLPTQLEGPSWAVVETAYGGDGGYHIAQHLVCALGGGVVSPRLPGTRLLGPAEAALDDGDLGGVAIDALEAVGAAAAAHLGTERIGLMGSSLGGYRVLRALARPDAPWAFGMSHGGFYDVAAWAEQSPVWVAVEAGSDPDAWAAMAAELPPASTPLLITHGTDDAVVAVSQPRALMAGASPPASPDDAADEGAAGADARGGVRYRELRGQGHGPDSLAAFRSLAVLRTRFLAAHGPAAE